MNPETGKFEPLHVAEGTEVDASAIDARLAELHGQLLRPDGSPVPRHWAIFKVGELVTVKDNTFKVAYMNEGTLILEPVPIDQTLLPPEE